MKLPMFFKASVSGLVLALACLRAVGTAAQSSRAITLDPPTGWELQDHRMDGKGKLLPEAPADFRRLGEATVGQEAAVHTLTLRFHEATRITGISVSKDFRIEQGGSCVEGSSYEKDSTCRLLVRFTPQGPGTRAGKLTVTHSASATPDAFGLGGFSYMPVVSFIPSIITIVPGTYPSGKGLLSGAWNLAVDGGDTVYIADASNNEIRYIDSSGTILSYLSGVTDPLGIAVDSFGDVYFSEASANALSWIPSYDTGAIELSGSGTDTCTVASPCKLGNETMTSPGQMAMDHDNHLFFINDALHYGAAVSTVQPGPAPTFANFYNDFADTGNSGYPEAFAVDGNGNLYNFDHPSNGWPNCEILSQTVYDGENNILTFTKIAGGKMCGFSGDGGQANNAEISKEVGQITFDTGGNLYFTDRYNQRVRRIDYATGIIRTVAGNGTAGDTNDGGAATNAELSNPTGVGVDSLGQVYIISGAVSTGQVVRKVGTTGVRNFVNQLKGTHSAPLIAIVTNTGNYELQLTSTALTGSNPSDFAVDPTTTSCLLTAGSTLQSGYTCQIGFIFTPSAAGARSANFVMLDNTGTNSNTISLLGNGTLPAATFKITSPTNGASFTSGTSVTFSVSVEPSSGPAPTGTVQFKVDGTNYGSPWAIASGTASTSVGGLSTAPHTLSATYSGDSNYAPGGPVSVSITVTSGTIHQPTVTMLPIARTNTSCVPQTFNVTVSASTGFLPTGTVQLLDGGHTVSTATLAEGKAVLSSPPLTAGTHSLTTEYGGDAHNLAAVSPALVEAIRQAGSCSQPVDRVGMR